MLVIVIATYAFITITVLSFIKGDLVVKLVRDISPIQRHLGLSVPKYDCMS